MVLPQISRILDGSVNSKDKINKESFLVLACKYAMGSKNVYISFDTKISGHL